MSFLAKTLTYYSGFAVREHDLTDTDRSEDTVYYILKDHLNGTNIIADETGTLISEWVENPPDFSLRYTAFGESRFQTGSLVTDIGYTGQRQESALDLYFYNARWYDPALGRFAQADTILPDPRDAKAFDRYAYGLNNPVRFNDPSGHWPDWMDYLMGAAYQYSNDMTGGFVEDVAYSLDICMECNNSDAFNEGQEAGRVASTIVSTTESVVGAYVAVQSVAAIPTTLGLGGACTVSTGGTCGPAAGLALTGEVAGVVVGTAVSVHGTAVATYINQNPLGSDSSFNIFSDMNMSGDDAMDAAWKFLGEEPVYMGNGRYVSADGTRQVRMSLDDLSGNHADGAHINFEYLGPNKSDPSRMSVTESYHVYFLED